MAVDIGSRPTSTETEGDAADYIADQLSSFGYEVEQPSFQFDVFVDLGSSLEVVSPEQRSLRPAALNPSSPSEVEAEIVEAGLGRPEDFPAVSVRLDARVQSGGESQNVVARPPGGECDIFVGGHYDSVAAGPGANDNASGTTTVIEMARTGAADGQFDDVCFLLFGAEEIGLIGSQAFVSSLSDEERGAIQAMLNFDVVGTGQRGLLRGSDTLVDIAVQEAGRLGVDYSPGQLPTGSSSDHASFINADTPALIVHQDGDSRLHTSEGKVEFHRTKPARQGRPPRLSPHRSPAARTLSLQYSYRYNMWETANAY